MKVTFTGIKHALGLTLAAGTLAVAAPSVRAQSDSTTLKKDTFELSVKVPATGTTGDSVLLYAPSPKVELAGEPKNAAIVVDLSKNVLYQYDVNGKATCAYLVASGKKSTPTKEGLRIVTHVESYPYKSAPASTKRRRKPWDYGPRVICLDTIDPETGKRGRTGQFIHGNANPKSIGKHASLGCIRMDNEIIKKLAKEVKRGDLIRFIR
ncbi:TPA: L,D-transpeptidase [Candidatus Scatenecus faecavium]|uniref:L,D-transpeptidase n=1 Tax=Candidatus Scatenecus faecavium TaxID=2840915 RepID=A0A9D1FXH1_9BACT|nr:L,D-transpeptidase [Candidatus Scatenecus faecavium]